MNNIDVFNPNNRPTVIKWFNNVAKFDNTKGQYNRLSSEYETIRDLINKNGPSNTMSKVNSAFSNLNRQFKTKKGGKRRNRTRKHRR